MSADLHALLCLGASQRYFDTDEAHRAAVHTAITATFTRLSEDATITVLGSLDDDMVMTGPCPGWPHSAYVLLHTAGLHTLTRTIKSLASAPVLEERLWQYLRIESRIGKPLF